MVEPLNLDTLQLLARALIAQMAPATGTRATGTMSVTAPAGGGDLTLERNTYMMPVVDRELRQDWLFKVGPDPSTLNSDGTGGDWLIPDGTTVGGIAILSNVGGLRHNIPAGSLLRFDPPVPGFDPDEPPFVEAELTDGNDSAALIKRVNYFEDVSPADVAQDFFAADLPVFPAVAVVWESSEPLEGRTAGASQGSTRLKRGTRAFRETFAIIIAAGQHSSDKKRRHAGLTVMQAISRLISDRKCNDDGETLSTMGAGAEINGRGRFVRQANLYVYTLSVRLNSVLQGIDSRAFNDWLTVNLEQALPGREAPEPTTPLTVVDIDDPIP